MPRYKDITGQRFGKLLVLELAEKARRWTWLCKCDCGKTLVVRSDCLRNGNTKTCGCSVNERIVHGMEGTKTYKSWDNMIQRCFNPKATGYKYWGGRGITVCERWFDFSNFFADMGEQPKGLTIDRIDNDKNYEPENCRWVTRSEQIKNKRQPKRRKAFYSLL